MTAPTIAAILAALVVALTPWCVVRIAFAIARRQARRASAELAPVRSMPSLDRLTLAALAIAGGAALLLPAPSLWIGGIDLLVFTVLAAPGLRALGELDDASRPWREIVDPVRVASLQPRALRDYVPAAWRVMLSLALAAGLGMFAWRFFSGVSPRQPLLPLAFATSAAVFAWLYDTWMRELASGGDAPGPDGAEARLPERRREVRGVFAAESVLVVACLTTAHALLDLDWSRHAGTGAAIALAGAVIGVTGCALAVASELGRRRYRRVDG